MDTTESLISKVLIYEPEPEHQAFLKNYCDQSKLLGLRVDSLHRIFRVLEKNVDLGAILISEETGNEMRNVAMHHIVAELIRERPELRLLRLANNRAIGVQIWLGLREPVPLQATLREMNGVSEVRPALEQASLAADESALDVVLMAGVLASPAM